MVSVYSLTSLIRTILIRSNVQIPVAIAYTLIKKEKKILLNSYLGTNKPNLTPWHCNPVNSTSAQEPKMRTGRLVTRSQMKTAMTDKWCPLRALVPLVLRLLASFFHYEVR